MTTHLAPIGRPLPRGGVIGWAYGEGFWTANIGVFKDTGQSLFGDIWHF